MTDSAPHEKTPAAADVVSKKKTYEKPAFRHEQVFETQALSCGKVAGDIRSQCHLSRKTS
jgi:hypothetical protein